MKKSLLFIALGLFLVNVSFAQEVKPSFEKQNDLVKATYFYEDGQIKEVGFFKDDKLHDKWISYDKTGKVKVVANYENGMKEGTWYITGENSVKVVTYKSNRVVKVEEVDELEESLI